MIMAQETLKARFLAYYMGAINMRVAGTGSYLPSGVIPNDFFVGDDLIRYGPNDEHIEIKKFDSADKIFDVTGIRERRRAASNENAISMGYEAAIRALDAAKIKPKDLSGLFFASVTEPRDYPGGAAEVGACLDMRDFLARNLKTACCGYVDSLIMARERGTIYPGNYLVIGSEHMSSMVDWRDINSTLFGDGAGAAVLVPCDDSRGIVAGYSACDPSEGRVNYIFRNQQRFLRMPNGSQVLKEAVEAMVQSSKQVKQEAGWEHADVYIPHQANGRILDRVEKSLQDMGAVVYKTISRYGNMSAATCAVALDEAIRDGTVVHGNLENLGSRVVIPAFASGLSRAAVAIQF